MRVHPWAQVLLRWGAIFMISVLLGEIALRLIHPFVPVPTVRTGTYNDFRSRPFAKSLGGFSLNSKGFKDVEYTVWTKVEPPPRRRSRTQAYDDQRPSLKKRVYYRLLGRKMGLLNTEEPSFGPMFPEVARYLEKIHSFCLEREIDLIAVILPEELQVDEEVRGEILAARPALRRLGRRWSRQKEETEPYFNTTKATRRFWPRFSRESFSTRGAVLP